MLSVDCVSHIDPCQGACTEFQSVTIDLKGSLAEYGVGMPPDSERGARYSMFGSTSDASSTSPNARTHRTLPRGAARTTV